MNAYINISDPMYDIQADQPDDRQALKVGEAELATGYHSDLILTLRHDGPVMSVCFSANSVYVSVYLIHHFRINVDNQTD